MGALIAVVSKDNENTFTAATAMLDALSHRGSDSFGIASSKEVAVAKTLKELQRKCVDSAALIGYNHARLLPEDKPQPNQTGGSTFVFEGRLFPASSVSETCLAAERAYTKNGAIRFIREFEGSYVFAANVHEGVLVGRDVVGSCPLYFGENGRICAVASERKALWRVGITDTFSFSPGTLALVDEKGFHFTTARTIEKPFVRQVDLQSAAKQLAHVLVQSAKDRVSDLEGVAVAFSGGVDSSVVASLVQTCGAETHLIHVTLGETLETDFARHAAEGLDLPLHVARYTVKDVEESLPLVLWLIEEPNPVNASIAIPLFWIAEQVARLGLRVLMTGQGGDELFGGYARYLGDYEAHGLEGLQGRLYQDVLSSHEVNYQRDNKVCIFHKVEVRMPFSSLKVIELALSFPVGLKVVSPKDELRKRVLRQAAENIGVPRFVSERPKKAIQYTTGVSQALKKLAKKEDLTVREYVESVFKQVYCEPNRDD